MITFGITSHAVKETDTITVPDSVKSFESMVPSLTNQFRYACRYIKNRSDKEEAVQEMLTMAFANYKSLVDRKLYDKIYATPLGDYAVKSFFVGRCFTGQNSTDVTSASCQHRGRSDVRGLEYFSTSSHRWKEILVFDRYHRPSTIAAFKIDFEAWRETLDWKLYDILDAFLQGDTTTEISQAQKLSPVRISQIRRELVESWKTFVGNYERKHQHDDLLIELIRLADEERTKTSVG